MCAAFRPSWMALPKFSVYLWANTSQETLINDITSADVVKILDIYQQELYFLTSQHTER